MPRCLVASVAAAAALAGCGSGAAPTDGDASKALAAWRASGDDEEELYRLQRRLETRCMEKKGFRVQPGPPPGLVDRGRRNLLGGALPPTPQEAARDGYGFASGTEAAAGATQPSSDAWNAAPEAYKAKYTLAYEGPPNARATADTGPKNVTFPAQGCAGDVLKALMGKDLGAYIRLQDLSANGLRDEIRPGFDQKAMDELDRAWKACMGTAGERTLSEPAAARSRAMKQAEAVGADPTRRASAIAEEKALAAKDARCGQQVDYERTLQEIEGKASTEVLARHLPDLLQFQQIVADATVRARALMKQ